MQPTCFSKGFKLLIAIIILSAATGCTSLRRINPVPLENILDAEVVDFEQVRAFGGMRDADFQYDALVSLRQEPAGEFRGRTENSRQYDILVISGGGSTGAFGAGILYGWSKSGKRPKFKFVTGISTGALIAPFALLGSEYDEQLKEVYTTISAEDIYEANSLGDVLYGESLADTGPLARLVAKYVNQEMLGKIARAHQKGQRLYVATTSMDADMLVVWNMGKIASSGKKNALELFRKVLIASASVPGVFPPVYFDVSVDGSVYREMHADGGLKAQMFLNAAIVNVNRHLDRKEKKNNIVAKGNIYIIRNGRFTPEPRIIERNLPDILQRAVSSLTKTSGFGDLYRIYALADLSRFSFNYIEVPEDYKPVSTEEFDNAEMNNLFDKGYELSRGVIDWTTAPPGIED